MTPIGCGGTPGCDEELTVGRGRRVGQSTVREVRAWARLHASITILGDGLRRIAATRIVPGGSPVGDVLDSPPVHALAAIASVTKLTPGRHALPLRRVELPMLIRRLRLPWRSWRNNSHRAVWSTSSWWLTMAPEGAPVTREPVVRGQPLPRSEKNPGRADPVLPAPVSCLCEKGSFESPNETRTPDKSKIDVVKLGDTSAARITFQPGWKWSECIKPVVEPIHARLAMWERWSVVAFMSCTKTGVRTTPCRVRHT
jgi:hypothetical protein